MPIFSIFGSFLFNEKVFRYLVWSDKFYGSDSFSDAKPEIQKMLVCH